MSRKSIILVLAAAFLLAAAGIALKFFNFGRGVPLRGQNAEDTPPGASTDCHEKADAAFKVCLAKCKGRSDLLICCGECDLAFSTTFTNCCNDTCKVNNPPASCSDDSGPGCAGGVVTPSVPRPEWCPGPANRTRQ